MNIVLTGLKNGDMVYLAPAPPRIIRESFGLNTNWRHRQRQLVIISSFGRQHSPATQEASNIAKRHRGDFPVPLNLSTAVAA